MDVPWWMLSPSPVSLIQYAVLIWIFWGYMMRTVKYEKHGRILAFCEAAVIVFLFVLVTDSFWCFFTAMRWLPLFPGDALQIFSSLGRDLLAAGVLGMFIWDRFKERVLDFNIRAHFWLMICFVSQAAWFLLAPSPAWTDYTYAWRHGSDIGIIMGSWILSHWIMRIPLWLALVNIRRKL